ncbi:hypothetical protein FZC74_04745 [Sutcliffiella horikoshii]|uniref:Flagellar hook-length control protein-like C-terminal domain-containing protein n=1 Tax=Sutcliffiella horikoshii TaxID=79883 RepID=A0AA94WYK7_9BACI|nr:hypothetical protein [Sutcliffiella horikoshii]TYS61591.1 hypothetical protein FZC74_04745 [Sutcliffiella horikoshii]
MNISPLGSGVGKAQNQATAFPATSQTAQVSTQALITQIGGKMPSTSLKEVTEAIDSLPPSQKEKAMELVKVLVQRNGLTNLPEKLQMMVTSFSDKETILQNLAKVETYLEKANLPPAVQEKLINVIRNMQLPQTLNNKTETLHFIKQVLPLLGLNFEQNLNNFIRQDQPLSEAKLEQLKPLLLNYMNQATTPEESAAIGQLISKLTSFQLLTREEGNLHHVFLPIPVNMENESKEWYVHISSQKKNEELDSEYCRVVLLLDLPIFSSVMVDVLVQKKVIGISFQHSYPALESLVEKSAPLLKENLAKIGYTLSNVKTECKETDHTPGIPLGYLRTILAPPKEGVDIRI